MVYIFNTNTQKTEAGGSEFDVSLVTRASSSTARATEKPSRKKIQKQNKTKTLHFEEVREWRRMILIQASVTKRLLPWRTQTEILWSRSP